MFGSFPFVPPSLVGAYYLQPPDARAIFFHVLLCNGTCSVTGEHNVLVGGTNGKDSNVLQLLVPNTRAHAHLCQALSPWVH